MTATSTLISERVGTQLSVDKSVAFNCRFTVSEGIRPYRYLYGNISFITACILGSELYKCLTEASDNENNAFNAVYWTSVLSGLW